MSGKPSRDTGLGSIAKSIKAVAAGEKSPSTQLARDLIFLAPSWSELKQRGVSAEEWDQFIELATRADALPRDPAKRRKFENRCEAISNRIADQTAAAQ